MAIDSLKDLMDIAKATNLGRLSNKKARGMSTFDFDETVGISNNFVIAKKGGKTKKIASNEWPFVGDKMIAAHDINKESRWYKDYDEMEKALSEMEFSGVDVLLKGSRSLRLERVVNLLKRILS